MIDDLIGSIRVRVDTSRTATVGPWWHYGNRQDGFSRLYFIDAGRGMVKHSGKQFVLRPGRLYLIPATAPHSVTCDTSLTVQFAHFTLQILGGLSLFQFTGGHYERIPDSPAAVKTDLSALIAPEEDLMDQLTNTEIIIRLVRPFLRTLTPTPSQSIDIMRFRPVFERMEQNIGQRLSVPDLADTAGLSRAHFTRTFTQIFGQSPARYLRRMRIQRAAQLLLRTSDTNEGIARQAGFTDAFHFSRSFKTAVGVTPSEFRRRGLT